MNKLVAILIAITAFVAITVLVGFYYVSFYYASADKEACYANVEILSNNLSTLQGKYDSLSNEFESSKQMVSDYPVLFQQRENFRKKLDQCLAEKSSLMNSPSFYYDQRIQYTEQLKKQAGSNLKVFEAKEFCENWVEGCETYDSNGYCTNFQEYCTIYNPDVKIYQDYANKNPEWKGNYQLRNVIAQYNYVSDNIQYSLGMGTQTATETLNTLTGKCDEQASLLVSLIRANGGTAFIAVTADKTHAITLATFDGMKQEDLKGTFIRFDNVDYMMLDTTCKGCAFGMLPDSDIKNQWNIVK